MTNFNPKIQNQSKNKKRLVLNSVFSLALNHYFLYLQLFNTNVDPHFEFIIMPLLFPSLLVSKDFTIKSGRIVFLIKRKTIIMATQPTLLHNIRTFISNYEHVTGIKQPSLTLNPVNIALLKIQYIGYPDFVRLIHTAMQTLRV